MGRSCWAVASWWIPVFCLPTSSFYQGKYQISGESAPWFHGVCVWSVSVLASLWASRDTRNEWDLSCPQGAPGRLFPPFGSSEWAICSWSVPFWFEVNFLSWDRCWCDGTETSECDLEEVEQLVEGVSWNSAFLLGGFPPCGSPLCLSVCGFPWKWSLIFVALQWSGSLL